MHFGLLLSIVSLAIIIPVFFVWKEKFNQKSLKHQTIHQKHVQAQKSLDQQKKRDQEAKNLEKKYENQLSLHHLPVEKLPKLFQLVLLDIEKVCFDLNAKKVPQEKWFTLKRLIHKHLTELIDDYLSLSQEYASTHILDKNQNLTAEELVHAQLKLILNFLNESNNDVDNIKANDILVTRNYLKSLYNENEIL